MPSERYHYYLEQCAEHHRISKTFSGNGCLKHANTIVDLAREVGAESGLDWGCGKGNQYRQAVPALGGLMLEEALGFTVAKYDPAVPDYTLKPEGMFDLVWCTDVLEHIPEEDIAWVATELGAYARKALFVTVGFYPSKKTLPNGENTHITLKPKDWWAEQFAEVAKKVKLVMLVG